MVRHVHRFQWLDEMWWHRLFPSPLLFAPCCLQGDCSANDPFADYEGSLRCLMEGAGACAAVLWLCEACCHRAGPELQLRFTRPAAFFLRNSMHTWPPVCQGAQLPGSFIHVPYHLSVCLAPLPPPNADVAFTKHSTVLEVPTDGSAPASWANKKKVGPGYFTVLFTVALCVALLC